MMRALRKNTFIHLKIWFFKLNNTFFESDRLAALIIGLHLFQNRLFKNVFFFHILIG